jgi:uncharacterized Ntn-hydrolase superfamily protein
MITQRMPKTSRKKCAGGAGKKTRNAGTYSIIAYDPEAGQIGVAVQSHWFAVGALVAWAKAGVGAVATQSFIEPSYGSSGLEMMGSGKSAPETLAALLAEDGMKDVRQVAMIDVNDGVDAFTGDSCVDDAGHIVGHHFSVQANMMENERVVPMMEKTYAASTGDLAERLLLTLEAAESAGGDIRGRQAAAMLVVRSKATGNYTADRVFDLRVDDHRQPLDELRRLVNVARAYQHMNRGDDVFTRGDFMEAVREYRRSADMLPGLVEAKFWQAVALAAGNRMEAARPIFAEVFSQEPRWRKMVKRLPKAGILPDEANLIDDITGIEVKDRG